ncbi:response regulator transcription factor [Actinospica sp.]|jgi:DNA-binding response OmpR family regulator|uniref:response regulator transcription factor n=1 Tax=Actinospica sp. TaxID=1872142 RepID=UPI002BA96401|nr:response regulator transcription factor [Actinospica sp.]HWG23336.1 response regulator transcription factor [Actinospica sp.]
MDAGTEPRPRTALVIEDAPDICLLVCDTLRQAGFEATGAGSGARGLELAKQLSPDLVTLDLTLPDIDGIEVCRQLRAVTNAYVIVLSARDEETDRLIGLEVGADDYMVKPFSPRELRARVGALFRRPRLEDPGAEPHAGSVMRIGELRVDRESREVTLDGAPVGLTRTEFDLLAALMSRPHRVWERDTLARVVQHTDWPGDDHVIDVHIANLRHKLGDTGRSSRWVQTVRGVGYRFGNGEGTAAG